MKVTSVKGTNDYLPKETALRDYLQGKILETYRSCGFERITTPILEDMENLDKSEGGENLNLLFKILKRGDKLTEALNSGNPKELSDIGLRYDLTLPLSRYYACNRNNLSTPFKVIQLDRVFRAERPQKGRLREFIQCDIDILGSSSTNCEVELIDTTAKALLAIGIENFKVRINDRRILKNLILSAGFHAEDSDSVCITFDKMDKIGAEGVRNELLGKDFAADVVEKFISMISITPFTLDDAKKYCTDTEAIDSVASIIATVKQLSGGRYDIEYDRSLVRGQGYYTGTIFEVESLDFGSSIAGGGRYDNMIGKFIGESVPAVGFSIGFERIASILMDRQTAISASRPKLAVIYPDGEVVAAIKKADEYRGEYDVTLYEKPKKIGKLFGKLEESGFYGCLILDESAEIKVLQK
ncbi:MAG: histidine--tRNA ligase [Lachnospiraceae bacterium]|nr:histidine--tRNA ligase [Lachnospiraceae bacterium]